jgi:F-box and WD-40 domain protein CDC4
MAWNNGGAQITACPNDIGNALVTSLQMDEEFIVVGCDNNRIEVFDATTGSYLRTLRGHHGGVWALQFVKTDTHCILVSGGCDR